ncbi:MAG: hypothetical protein ACO1SX_10235 [Actinomycetota bacterium]
MDGPHDQDAQPTPGASEITSTNAPGIYAAPLSAAELARRILACPRIKLSTHHQSRVRDNATPDKQLAAIAQGQKAARSSYGSAPGGTVALDRRMLAGILGLAETYTFSITEIAGGAHYADSRHYAGVAFDVVRINGAAVNATHPHWRAFLQKGRALGATETLGPGVAGHATHLHLGWPRSPAAPNGGLVMESQMDSLLEEVVCCPVGAGMAGVLESLRQARTELDCERARISVADRLLLPEERSRLAAVISASSHISEALRALEATG